LKPILLVLLITTALWQLPLNAQSTITIGAQRFDILIDEIGSSQVGLVVNHTSQVAHTHLVDTLHSLGVSIHAIFAPEHGFTGQVERGKNVSDDQYNDLDIPIISIYGAQKKPTKDHLRGIDLMIFDMQDVGVRFFTYISTLHYVMEACAENNIPLLVLDRPNPLDHYVDGPILDPEYASFIGMHEVPIVHGMTIGEYALMINGQKWLDGGMECQLKVIELEGYQRGTYYQLPLKPSPNLPDMRSVYLYPSICLFEGTEVSEGRGTLKPFQKFGTPWFQPQSHGFVPISIAGLAQSPKFQQQQCFGYDLSKQPLLALQLIDSLNLDFLIEFYNQSPDKEQFFSNSKHFDLLAGSDQLRKQIISGLSSAAIRRSWQPKLRQYLKMRAQYLLYQ